MPANEVDYSTFFSFLIQNKIYVAESMASIDRTYFSGDWAKLYIAITKHYQKFHTTLSPAVMRELCIKNQLKEDEVEKFTSLVERLGLIEVNYEDFEFYLKEVKEAHFRNEITASINDVTYILEDTGKVFDEENKKTGIFDVLKSTILKVEEQKQLNRGLEGSINESVQEIKETYERIENNPTQNTGILSNWAALDAQTNGFKPGELAIILGKRGSGKCITGNARLQMIDGSTMLFEDFVKNKINQHVLLMDENKRLIPVKIKDWIESGEKECFEITTRLGYNLTTSDTHPFLVLDGFKELKDLQIGNFIGVVRHLSYFGKHNLSNERINILAGLLCEGYLGKTITFTNKDPEIMNIFIDSISKEGSDFSWSPSRVNWEVFLKKQNQENKVQSWLKDLKLLGKKSADKFIPEEVFTLRKDLIARFLGMCISCDGSIQKYYNKKRKTTKWCISFATISQELTRGIRDLFLKFGIVGKFSKNQRAKVYKNTDTWVYEFNISDYESLQKFINEIGFYVVGSKQVRIRELTESLKATKSNPNLDLIPKEIWEYIKKQRMIKNKRWQDILPLHTQQSKWRGGSTYTKYCPSRSTLLAIGQKLEDQYLINLATSDIYWDEIISIKSVGIRKTYDIEVDHSLHNFVINNFIVHNSQLLTNLGYNAWLQGKSVIHFTIEMPLIQVRNRYLSRHSLLDYKAIRDGRLTPDCKERYFRAIEEFDGKANTIYIVDEPHLSTSLIESKYLSLKFRGINFDLIIVDYLNIMHPDVKQPSDWLSQAQISLELKELARRLKVPVLTGAQRNAEKLSKKHDTDRMGRSKAIGDNADLVMMIGENDNESDNEELGEVNTNMEIYVVKCRDGENIGFSLYKDFSRVFVRNPVENPRVASDRERMKVITVTRQTVSEPVPQIDDMFTKNE